MTDATEPQPAPITTEEAAAAWAAGMEPAAWADRYAAALIEGLQVQDATIKDAAVINHALAKIMNLALDLTNLLQSAERNFERERQALPAKHRDFSVRNRLAIARAAEQFFSDAKLARMAFSGQAQQHLHEAGGQGLRVVQQTSEERQAAKLAVIGDLEERLRALPPGDLASNLQRMLERLRS